MRNIGGGILLNTSNQFSVLKFNTRNQSPLKLMSNSLNMGDNSTGS